MLEWTVDPPLNCWDCRPLPSDHPPLSQSQPMSRPTVVDESDELNFLLASFKSANEKTDGGWGWVVQYFFHVRHIIDSTILFYLIHPGSFQRTIWPICLVSADFCPKYQVSENNHSPSWNFHAPHDTRVEQRCFELTFLNQNKQLLYLFLSEILWSQRWDFLIWQCCIVDTWSGNLALQHHFITWHFLVSAKEIFQRCSQEIK